MTSFQKWRTFAPRSENFRIHTSTTTTAATERDLAPGDIGQAERDAIAEMAQQMHSSLHSVWGEQ